MAATASFKQQCPSCEAWVPIRDPNLIGRKIDCPKCKYRFVVEEPSPEEDDEQLAESPEEKKPAEARKGSGKGTAVKGKAGPRRRDGDGDEAEGKAKGGKGSSGGSAKLIVGVGLGFVAVGILVAVAVFIFMNSDAPKPAPPAPPLAVTPRTPAPAPEEPAPAAEPAPEEGEKPAPTAPAATVALPGSIEVLTNLLPPDAEGACNIRMKDFIRTALGRTIFATPGAFRSEAIQHKLGLPADDIDLLVQAWNFTQNWSFHVVHTIRPINRDAVKAALRARPAPEGKIEDQEYFLLEPNAWLDSLGSMSFAMLLQINPAQVPARSGARALRIFDDQTLVLADLAPMKQFLAVKGRFPPKQQPKEATPKDADNSADAGGLSSAAPPRGRGAPPAAEPAESETPAPAPSGSYLTINPKLKDVLDVMDRKQPVVSLAVDTLAARGRLPSLGLRALEATLNAAVLSKLAVKTILEEAGILGACLQLKDGIVLTLVEDCQSEDSARRRYTILRRDTAPELTKVLGAALGTPVELLDEEPNNPDNPFGGGPAASSSPGLPTPGGPRLPGFAPPAGRPGVLGGGGATRPGFPYGSPGMSGRGAFQTQAPPAEPEKPKPGSTIKIEIPEKAIVLLTISLIDPAVNSRLMNGKIRQLVLQQKGYLDMAGGQLRIHEVGDAVHRYVEEHQQEFPRGALERPIPSLRAGRPYEPKQRISWLVELLPYLGPEQHSLYRGIDRNKAWNDPENLGAAATLIPQFLSPNYSPATWWVRYPSMTELTAATHYVGIAGIGRDAAEYAANDPAMTKKLGVFGYDRKTRLQDITDGASTTILMAQVPPTYKRPWMAGGGSTVEGVPEQDSVRPFVSPQADGKRGALVVMADGSVRFVSENIKDEVFKALCTIKGGESDLILDRDAPPVPRPEVTSEPQAPPAAPTPSQPIAAAPATGEWKDFTSQEGGFTAAFPGSPKEMKVSQKTPLGNLDAHIVGVELPGGAGGYVINYTEVPEAVSQQPGGADLLLDTIPQQVKGNLPGAAIAGEIKKITQDSYPGREVNLDIPGKGNALVRVFLVKNRVYQVMIVGSKEIVASKDAQRFLDSFHLGDK